MLFTSKKEPGTIITVSTRILRFFHYLCGPPTLSFV